MSMYVTARARPVLIALIIADVVSTYAGDVLALFGTTVVTPNGATSAVFVHLPATLRYAMPLCFEVALLAGWIGMAFTWSPARYLYMLAWLLSLAGTLLCGPCTYTPLGMVIELCIGFTGGFLICYVFLGDGRPLFQPDDT